MQKITPLLWFDANAEEAVNYYVSICYYSGKGVKCHIIKMTKDSRQKRENNRQ